MKPEDVKGAANKSMTPEMNPQFRHDLVSSLNTLYSILFADTQGWEPIHPSVREQLSLIVEKLAAIIPDEDRILKKNWTVVAPAVCQMRNPEGTPHFASAANRN